MNKRATTKEQYSALLDQCLHRVKSCVEQHVSREEHTSATSQQAPLALEAGPLMQQPALPQALPPPLAPTESDPSARWHTLSALTDSELSLLKLPAQTHATWDKVVTNAALQIFHYLRWRQNLSLSRMLHNQPTRWMRS